MSDTNAVNAVEETIAGKETELEIHKTRLEALVSDRNLVDVELAKLREETRIAISVLSEKQSKLREDIFDTKRAIRKLVLEIEALRKQLALDQEALMLSRQFIDNAHVFSKRISEYAYSKDILPHQMEGACILANAGRAILGDKRGLGKTLTVIATLDALEAQRVIVFAPDDVASNFVDELSMWAPHRTVVSLAKLDRNSRDLTVQFAKMMNQFTIVINYSAWRKDKTLINKLTELRFDTVICDEAHELRNTATTAFKGVRSIVLAENVCPMCQSHEVYDKVISKGSTFDKIEACRKCDWASNGSHEWARADRCSVKNVYPMTGTVILNKPGDLFALLHLIDPDIFVTLKDFLRMYAYNPYGTKWVFKPGGLESLTARLSGKYLARDESTAGVVRPKQSIIVHEIDMVPADYPLQSLVINQLTEHAEIILESGTLNALETITLILRKRQANVWPAGINIKNKDGDVVFSVGDEVRESIKLDKIIKSEDDGMIPEFTESGSKELGSRVVVFSQFKDPLAELENRCRKAGITVARLDGDTDTKQREAIKHDFDRRHCEAPEYNEGAGYKWQVLLCNYKTGGAGLNFNSATESIFLDEEWSPGKADQATGRTDRMGQTQENNVHILRLSKSIDTWMKNLNEEKAAMIEGFESSANGVADSLLLAMRNGDVI